MLERRGRAAAALELYVKARASEAILNIIEREGFALFERGEAADIAAALDVLPDAARAKSATAIGLRAMIDASLGRFEIAEREFLAAIELAENDEDIRLRLVHRYAIERVRSDRDCIPFLEPFAGNRAIEARYRIPLLTTLATGYVHAGRGEEALRAIDHALTILDASISDETRARAFQQAAYVERYAGSKEKAKTYANTAIDLALANDWYELAARAYSVLYTIVHDTDDDPIESLAILDTLSECARKGASSQARLFALVASYDVEVERGDDQVLEQLDRQMRESQAILPRLRSTAVLAVQALRAAWKEDFASAYEMLAGTAQMQTTAEQRALRAAETALYALAAGLQDEGDLEIRSATDALTHSAPGEKEVIRARLLTALAELMRGHDAAAHRQITEAERALTASLPRLRSFAHAVRTLYRVQLGQADAHAMNASLERLNNEHSGGLARLLSALPLARSESGYAVLTPAEREILQMLAKGASTKDVAGRTGRSPHTVDTHIRSICRKLHCSGRREAIALATSQGWVQG